MTLTHITNKTTWNHTLAQFSNAHILQTWDWGRFKSRWGWQPTRLLWSNESHEPLAMAQILQRPIPKTPFSIAYISKGPVWDYKNIEYITSVLHDLENYARQTRALFIKIDPDVPIAYEPSESQHDQYGHVVKACLLNRGWQFSKQQIQFKNTVILDIRPDETSLLKQMKSKWRYNIRLAIRKGVTIRQGNISDLETFYNLYAITSQRDGFLIRPKEYYLDAWHTFLNEKHATLLFAMVDNVPIAGLILFYLGQTAWYMYGASNNQHRSKMPNHLLQWEAIKLAKSVGCTVYDMWGAPDVLDESDSMWGVYKFKKGFAGMTQQGLGAYDYPTFPVFYLTYKTILPKMLSLLRNRNLAS